MNNAIRPKQLQRDDGIIATLNEDDGTYTLEHQRISMPTTFYRYSLELLISTGVFKIIEEKNNE